MSKALQQLRDSYTAGLERVDALQALLDTSASESGILAAMVHVSVCGERIAEQTREVERIVQAPS